MPKLRDSSGRPNILEVARKRTRRGPRITMVPVNDGHPTTSRNHMPLPLKKRSLSPMLLDVDNAEVYETEEISNQLRATGKV